MIINFRLECQCPQRAYSHFYKCGSMVKRMSWYVSMPSTSLLPFLRSQNCWNTDSDDSCQCPQRAYSHFYGAEKFAVSDYIVCQCPQRAYSHFYACGEPCKEPCHPCVNALNELTPISTVASRNP